MADGLRSLRWRDAIGVVGAVRLVAWLWMSGSTRHLIQVDYSCAREMLDSAEVQIDGVVLR